MENSSNSINNKIEELESHNSELEAELEVLRAAQKEENESKIEQ